MLPPLSSLSPLAHRCPMCAGTGVYTLGWHDLSAYGATLLRAIANGARYTSELPLQGTPPARTMALKRLVELGLIERTDAPSGDGYRHDLTDAGRALADTRS